MHILIVSQYFLPQPLANAEVIGGLAGSLAARGHRVEVVAPVDPAGAPAGVRVRRAFGWFAHDRRSIPQRLLEYGTFAVGAAVRVLTLPKPDVIVVPSPPPSLGLVGLVMARLRGIPFVYNVQDLYPEIAGAVSSPPGLFVRLVRRLVAILYSRSEAIVVIDTAFESVIRRAEPRSRVHAIRNGIDLRMFDRARRDEAYLDSVGVPRGVPVVMYAGNVGRSQDLEAIIVATAAAGAHLVVHGGGAALESLRAWVRAHGHDHVHFSGFRPREELGRIFASADLHLVPLRPGVAWSSVPSKLLSIFAAGRPAILGAESGTPAAAIVAEANGGWVVEPGDDDALVAALRAALDNRAELVHRGRAARRWAETWAGTDRAAAEWENLLATIVRRS